MSSRRECEPVYEKHPKLSALSRVTNARESARDHHGAEGLHFHKAECLPLLRSSIKLNVCMYDGTTGGVGGSDRHEHAFPVTDSSGQTLPHNVYHLLRAGGM